MDSDDSKSGRQGNPVLLLYRELWKQSEGRRSLLVAAMLLLVAAQLVLLLAPYLVGRAFNVLQMTGEAGAWHAALWLLAMLGATLASWLIHGPARIIERNVALEVRKRVAAALTERLLAFPLSWHDEHHSVASTHRVQQSSAALGTFAESQFIYLGSAIKLVGPIGLLLIIHPLVGVVAAIGLLAICISVVGFDRAMLRLAIRANDAERRYSATLADALGNATTMQALRQTRPFVRLLQQRVEALVEPFKRMIMINEGKWCVVDIASRLLSCCLVGLYAWLALRSSAGEKPLMLGDVYMVWEYALQAGTVVASVAMNFQVFATQYANYQSADVIREIPVSEVDRQPVPYVTWEHCEIRDVLFRFKGERSVAPILTDIHLSLQRGKRYALIGKSGAGKTTLLRILAGLYVADQIKLDRGDADPSASPADAARLLRGSTTLIPQEAQLFEASLASNLEMCESLDGQPVFDDFRLALELAVVSEFLASDADPMQVLIAENASNWSGGQRARVALARGILAARGSSMVLFDEPTSNLDAPTELIVYRNLFKHFSDMCLIASVHRLDLLKYFDEILVLENGRLVAQGTEVSLAEKSKEYLELRAASLRESG
ncbi:ABC-type multidrug transport system fused ATPase/permease subunit [Xanthomonas arboricola]|uniref:ATP-binding cassette domain-containing protein n=1 Tax=Xanthomonas TaxID=338 RepID=UPI000F8CDE16|nr:MULTISPECIES: ABC transporter ATP-binding protein [Xanthomonas]NJC37122.1 ABC-type multidrug transport system fused ATPase/permease subunit [Xanthomonas euroxanthea]